ncbi:unnamed protein product [Heterobilharzia americana]|nr:unnamed protein product [Heterobilharzia americana]
MTNGFQDRKEEGRVSFFAAIGRACTVEEDEDPPLTPVQSSLDLQQSDCIEQSLRLCTSTLEEIITLTLSLCKSIKILPNFNKAVILRNEMIKQQRLKANEMERNENEQPETSTECVSSPSTITNPTQSLVQTLTSTNNVNNLNKLTQLHRLCLTVYKVVHFETLNTTVKELSLGLTALLAHSENTIIKELHLFDCILRKFSISTNNIHSFQALYEKNSSNLLSDYHEFVLTTLLHVDEDSGDDDNDESDAYMTSRTTSTHYDHSSELGELRILCESLRQCWTQVKRLANEQRFIQYRINQLNTSNNYNLLLTRVFLDAFKLNSFYSKLLTLGIINSAQHLIYSGVSLLSYIELTRFTHDELWEMTRGIEELSILREYLHNTFQVYRNVHLHRFLFNNDTPVYCNTILFNINSNVNDSINNCKTLLSQIVTYDLIIDPGDVTFSITVGCLFSLFAKQRSLRLAHLTYLQLYKFLKLFTELTNINNNTTNDNSSKNI